MAAHALLETARDALFLARLPPSRLAWVYLAIAVVSLGLFVLQERSGARSGRAALATWLVGSAAVDVLLWVLIAQAVTWTLYLLYTWSSVFASLVVVRFWTLLGDLFSIGQAKRVFALIGAGGGAGAIGGLLLARALATERLFRLVGLLYSSEDARSLYRGVHDASPKVRDSSRELLEHLLEPPLQGAVLALVDDIADADRLARAQPYYVPPKLGYLEALNDLLDHGDAGTVGLVAYHIAEIEAVGLTPRLERLRASSNLTVVTAIRHALRQMGGGTTDGQ